MGTWHQGLVGIRMFNLPHKATYTGSKNTLEAHRNVPDRMKK